MGRIFELRTDHCGLKYLFDKPTLNARQARWLEFLCEFDFEIKCIKGKENKVVDALRRKVHDVNVIVTSECIHLYFLSIVTRCLFQDFLMSCHAPMFRSGRINNVNKSCQVIVGNPPIV